MQNCELEDTAPHNTIKRISLQIRVAIRFASLGFREAPTRPARLLECRLSSVLLFVVFST